MLLLIATTKSPTKGSKNNVEEAPIRARGQRDVHKGLSPGHDRDCAYVTSLYLILEHKKIHKTVSFNIAFSSFYF